MAQMENEGINKRQRDILTEQVQWVEDTFRTYGYAFTASAIKVKKKPELYAYLDVMFENYLHQRINNNKGFGFGLNTSLSFTELINYICIDDEHIHTSPLGVLTRDEL